MRLANRRGIRFMVLAMACFIANDSMVKLASATLPAAQLIFIRGLMASLLVLAVARATAAPIAVAQLTHRWVLVRAAIDAVASLTYLVSLFHLPIANATAINLASPLFIVNDALVKYASQTMPAAQLIFIRGVMATLLVLAAAQAMGAMPRIREIARGWVAVRGLVDAIGSLLVLVSLFHLPLANATAINMASPLFIVALAVPLLGERVDARRGAAIAAGFAGVLLVIQPRIEGFNAYALLCLAATLLHAVRDLSVRRIPPGVPSLAITLATAVAVTLLAGLLSVPQGWQPLGLREIALLAGASVFLASGYHLIIRSTRMGDMSTIAPWRYTGLLWALIVGWVIWGDLPNALGWAGIALLIAAGVYLIRRERGR
jgi:drug/metabolite transporter (DMT)-like permease